jgi:tRNA(fMet)-specific endonuclease VapC
MIYLLDTNTCIKYLNGSLLSIRDRIEKNNPNDISICSVVKAELFYGAMKSQNSNKNMIKLKKFFDRFFSFSFDDEASRVYGNIRSKLERAGTPIGPNDLMIASVAISNHLTLVSHNVREFERVKDLLLEDWEK